MCCKLPTEDDTACACNIKSKEHATRINGYNHSLVLITAANNENEISVNCSLSNKNKFVILCTYGATKCALQTYFYILFALHPDRDSNQSLNEKKKLNPKYLLNIFLDALWQAK